MDGYAGGDNYLWRIGACVRDERIAGYHSRPPMPQKNPAPRYCDLQVSQVTRIRFGLNKMYANMYVNVCSGHSGCGNRFMGKVHSWKNLYFDGHMRYRESKDIMITALKNGITRDRHTTYLCPPRDFNPSFGP